MIRGLYTAASGMIAGMKKQEIISDNLANIETNGYKANDATLHGFHGLVVQETGGGGPVPFSPFQQRVVGTIGSGAFLNEQPINFSQGTLKRTGGSLDVALQSRGYFAVQTPEGVRYTRDGQFRLDAERRLVTGDGQLLLGENGDAPIIVPPGEVEIDAQGFITAAGEAIGQLRIRDFADAAMVREGSTMFSTAGPEQALEPNVTQGSLEQSNVDAVASMTSALGTFQAYSTMQRAFQVQLDSLQRAITEVGRVG